MDASLFSGDLLAAIQEVIVVSERATPGCYGLGESLCMLFRITALTARDARAAIAQLREHLRKFVPDFCLIDSLSARTLEVVDDEEVSRESMETDLQSLLDEVRESRAELAEQTGGLMAGGECIMVLGEAENGVIEAAIRDAAESVVEEKGNDIEVVVVRVAPDHLDIAGGMAGRLGGVEGVEVKVVDDFRVSGSLKRVDKVLLYGLGVDVDDGGLCYRGAALVCAAANRMNVGVCLIVARHRLVPVGSSGVAVMSGMGGCPGMIWKYEESREDRSHDGIGVLAGVWDVVALQKCEMIVTEFGGYAPGYIKHLAPNFEASREGGEE